MDVKYTKLAMSDPDLDESSAFNFESVFTYERPDYFSYGKPNKDKYQSAFTYQGLDHNKTQSLTVTPEIPPAGVVCQIWAAFVTVAFYCLVFLTLPVSYFFSFKRVGQHERLVVYRLGRMLATRGPGTVIILPFIDSYNSVDLRLKAFSIPPLTILTSDDSAIEVGAEVFYHAKDAVRVVQNVKDLDHCLRNAARSCMQSYLGKHLLKDIQSPSNRRTIQIDLVREINQLSMPVGVEISQVDIPDIRVLAENTGLTGQQNPLQVLQTMLGGNTSLPGLPAGIPGVPGVNAENPLQQLASQFISKMGSMQGSGDAMYNIQPHLNASESSTLATDSDVSQSSTTPAKLESIRTADDLLASVQPLLSLQLVASFGYVYKFVLQGPAGGLFFLDLKNGEGKADRGLPPDDPDVTFTLSTDDLDSLLQGTMSPAMAYMSGRLLVEGDMSVASRLSDLIELIKKE